MPEPLTRADLKEIRATRCWRLTDCDARTDRLLAEVERLQAENTALLSRLAEAETKYADLVAMLKILESAAVELSKPCPIP